MGKMMTFTECAFIWMIISAGWNVSGQPGEETNTSNSRVTFKDARGFASIDNAVYHMEEDKFINGNILLSNNYTMTTTNRSSTVIVSGKRTSYRYLNGFGVNATFNIIECFVQKFNGDFVILADSFNHCLRLLNRRSGEVTDLAGKCNFPGYVNGNATKTAQFNHPRGLLFHPTDTSLLFVTDVNNNAIRLLNLCRKTVSTVFKSDSDLHQPIYSIWENNNANRMLVSTGGTQIKRLILDNQYVTTVSGSNSEYADGSVQAAKYQNTRELVYIGKQIYIVTDTWNHQLRLVDFLYNTVTSFKHSHWTEQPYSLLLANNTLYVGYINRIYTFSVLIENEDISITTADIRVDGSSGSTTTDTATVLPESRDRNKENQADMSIVGTVSGTLAVAISLIIILSIVVYRQRSTLHTLQTSAITNESSVPADAELVAIYESPENLALNPPVYGNLIYENMSNTA